MSGPCRVYVVHIRKGRVRIGIKSLNEATPVHVLRGELEERPSDERPRASGGGG